jgi:putative transcriptional regulator
MKKSKRSSSLGDEMVAGMSAFCDAVQSGEPLEKRFTIRTVRLQLQPKPYRPEDVKLVRAKLNASQALLAQFLGISVKTLRSWEQGTRPVPTIACRYLDDIVAYPELWQRRVQLTTSDNSGRTLNPPLRSCPYERRCSS